MRPSFALSLLLVACASGDPAESTTVEVPPAAPPSPSEPAPGCPPGKTCVGLSASDPEARISEVFATAKPGTVILLGEGTFAPTNTLAVAGDDVIVRGAGRDRTILDFRGQKAGGEGVLAENAKGLVLESFSVVDTRGNGVKVLSADGVTMRSIGVRWTSADATSHGAYGLYPVRSKRVLVEDCVATGASDAGIYIGQSDGTILRRNTATGNVGGIEIENSFDVDVYENTTVANTAGILVVDLPWVPQTGGHAIRVHHNVIEGNNTDNFSTPGSFVGSLPRGLGVMVMAGHDVEVFANTIRDNVSVNAAVVSFLVTGNEIRNDRYYPYPSRVFLHDNTFGSGGNAPDETKSFGAALASGMALYPGTVVPSIVYDGFRDPAKGGGPNPHEVCLRANGTATFVDLRSRSFDPAPHDCALPPVEPETVAP